MKITKDTIMHVANLARIDIDDSQIDKLSEQIGNILEYVDILENADTTGVAPTSHDTSMTNVFREDAVGESFESETALSNAPRQEDGHFVVPKSIG